MNWNSCSQKLPKDREEVIVFLNGTYFVVTYFEERKNFRSVNDGITKEIVYDGNFEMYWMALTPPLGVGC